MARRKLISSGLKQGGVTDKATRKRIKGRILSGKKKTGLVKAGVSDSTQRQIIKSNVPVRAEARAKRKARASARTERRQVGRVRRILPQGIRGSRRTGGGR